MKVKTKDPIYNRVIVKHIPGKVGKIIDERITEYKLWKTAKWAEPLIKKAIIETDVSKPSWVEIETLSRCNGTCEFCHVNARDDPRPDIRMSDELFFKIVDELHDIGFDGVVSVFSNNEPLMDSGIVRKLQYARAKLPSAYHLMYSNGWLLTPEKFEIIAKNLDSFVIDNYSRDGSVNKPVKKLIDLYGCKGYDNVTVWMRRTDEIMNTRGGEAPNRSGQRLKIGAACVLPFQQMYIAPDGKARLCCQDATWKGPVMGDVARDGVLKVWRGPEYSRVREHFKSGGERSELPVCCNCDFVCTGKHKDNIWGF